MTSTDLFNTYLAASVHEIKNAMNIHLAEMSQLRSLGSLNGAQTDCLQKLEQQTLFLNSQLTNLITHYKQSQKDFSLQIEQVFIDEFMEEFVTRHRLTQEVYHCALSYKVDENDSAFFDEQIINLILDTLIYNAAQIDEVSAILLRGYPKGDFYVLEVRDDGPGFPQTVIDHDNPSPADAQSDVHNKTGMGLWLARQLMAHHTNQGRHGSLKIVQSPPSRNPPRGATVQLFIP